MVKPWIKPAVMALVLFTGLLIWYFFFHESDEVRVRNRLRDLAECVSKSSGEKGTVMLIKSQQLDGFFADRCQIQVNEQMLTGDYTPEQLSAQITRGRQFFKSLSLSIHDPVVKVTTQEEAEIDFTGQVLGQTVNGERIREIRELRAFLSKKDGKWRFTAFRIREVLRK